MLLSDLLDAASAANSWKPQGPTSATLIESLLSECGCVLPKEYVEFLRISNGGNAVLKRYPNHCMFFPTATLLKLNEDAPEGLFVFASNAIGTHIAFNIKENSLPVCCISYPYLDNPNVELIASDFSDFLELIKT